MSPFSPYLFFVLFFILLASLWWLSWRIGLLIQEIVYLITGSDDLAMVILFLVYLPGILVHEASHWLVARILGLKTSKFRVWPKYTRNTIGLGSVTVSSGGVVWDSLVGLAPLLIGSALIVLIGEQVFDTQTLAFAWRTGRLLDGLNFVLTGLAQKPDSLLWSYLLFAIANAMMPSASDRAPLKSLGIYFVLIVAVFVLIDQSGRNMLLLLDLLFGPIQLLTGAFFLVTAIDLAVILLLLASRELSKLFFSQ
ncbi:MAG: hypothetical protein F4047_06275 [Caldilineaceae bacterium SB0670_bin_27]|uniref:Uncharacterized protein n=1 Tax=Caldilineaceae bacterium SB0664_bin_27 TaxID=2605260 RepID=A0A6B0YZ60_9CHLR|nr:hypothetical protein [Caldilineaceae bacterium SB0664_bin_27]MYJ77750.1 hypothetical protein [Caldilineaceae bacterium SB0670_bin_27]